MNENHNNVFFALFLTWKDFISMQQRVIVVVIKEK